MSCSATIDNNACRCCRVVVYVSVTNLCSTLSWKSAASSPGPPSAFQAVKEKVGESGGEATEGAGVGYKLGAAHSSIFNVQAVIMLCVV